MPLADRECPKDAVQARRAARDDPIEGQDILGGVLPNSRMTGRIFRTIQPAPALSPADTHDGRGIDAAAVACSGLLALPLLADRCALATARA